MRLPLALLTLVAASTLIAPAVAGPPGGDKRDPKFAARSLAEQGHALFEKGRYAEAIEALQQAERLYHAPTIVIALARAHAAAGKIVEARDLYQRVIDEKLPITAPPAFREAQRAARVEIAGIEKRIPTVRVVARGAAGGPLRLTVDDVEIAGWWPDRAIPVNPGPRRFGVAPVGAPGAVRTVDVKEGAPMVIEIDLPRAVAAPPPPPPSRPWLLPSIMSFGLAAVGVGVGIGTGFVTLNRASDLRARCGDVCPPTPENTRDVAAANAMGGASTVGFVLAGAGVVTGAVLLAVKPGGKPAEVKVGPGAIVLEGVF